MDRQTRTPGLPADEIAGPPDRRLVLASLLAAVAALALYAGTVLPEAGWGDSAELALQAHQLGVTHPPGYPVHTLLGKLFATVAGEPAIGTNWLSAVCTAGAIGLLGAWVAVRTGRFGVALLGPLVLAACPRIWEMAVTTEVYNVNLLFFALAVAALPGWSGRRSQSRLVLAGVALGVSLGSYLANILLVPGLLYLAVRGSRRPMRAALTYLGVAGVVAAALLSWSCWRCGARPPLGTRFLPNTVAGALRYFAGTQYGTLELRRPGFYLARVIEHAHRFARSFLYVGVVFGAWGVVRHWRARRHECIALLWVFLINMAYFTTYRAPDYYTMPTPAYLVFAFWIALGLAGLTEIRRRGWGTVAAVAAAVGLVAGLVWTQYPQRYRASRTTPTTDFAVESLRSFPPDAVVVAGWEKMTVLLYLQKTRGLRPDVTIIEREDTPLHYEHGTVEGYVAYVGRALGRRPVVIDRVNDAVRARFAVRPLAEPWSQLGLTGSTTSDSPARDSRPGSSGALSGEAE